MMPIFRLFINIILCIAIYSCNNFLPHNNGGRVLFDAIGRKVRVPDTICKIIPIGESTMRMVSYLKCTDKVIAIEDVEKKGVAFTHIFAHPELKQLPVIGPMNGGDPELMLLQHPDIIIASNMSAADADNLENKIGIPVYVICYGNLYSMYDQFVTGLNLLASLLNKETEAQKLLSFIALEKQEIKMRTQTETPREAYLGAISYQGRHDIVSTDKHYPAFQIANVLNTAEVLYPDSLPTIANTMIDVETLLRWNPPVIFIDQGGFRLVKNNFQTFSAFSRLLSAYHNKQVYLVWPYYMYHSNFEVMLVNAWNVGKVMYPDRFNDVDLREKTDRIMTEFVGKVVTDSLIQQWGWFRNISDEL